MFSFTWYCFCSSIKIFRPASMMLSGKLRRTCKKLSENSVAFVLACQMCHTCSISSFFSTHFLGTIFYSVELETSLQQLFSLLVLLESMENTHSLCLVLSSTGRCQEQEIWQIKMFVYVSFLLYICFWLWLCLCGIVNVVTLNFL